MSNYVFRVAAPAEICINVEGKQGEPEEDVKERAWEFLRNLTDDEGGITVQEEGHVRLYVLFEDVCKEAGEQGELTITDEFTPLEVKQ